MKNVRNFTDFIHNLTPFLQFVPDPCLQKRSHGHTNFEQGSTNQNRSVQDQTRTKTRRKARTDSVRAVRVFLISNSVDELTLAM